MTAPASRALLRVPSKSEPTATFQQAFAISCCNAQPQAIATLISIHNGECPSIDLLAIIPSFDSHQTLVVAVDDQHIGNTGHEVKRTLANLTALLDAVDKESVVRLGQ